MTSDPARDAIRDAIAKHAPTPEGAPAILTGWLVVCEWMGASDGRRWLAKAHDESLTPWAAAGMHHEALNGAWPDEGDTPV